MTGKQFSTRRQFLIASSGTFAFTLLASSIPARARATVTQGTARNAVVLYRANELHAQQFARECALAGCMLVELGNDPVRQWRDELRRLVIHEENTLLGLSNWADYGIVRGLAAEERRFPQLLVQHNKHQPHQVDWARHHANEILLASVQANSAILELTAENSTKRSAINTGQPSLFSWII